MEPKTIEQLILISLKATAIFCFLIAYIWSMVLCLYEIKKLYMLIGLVMALLLIFAAIFSGIYLAEYGNQL